LDKTDKREWSKRKKNECDEGGTCWS